MFGVARLVRLHHREDRAAAHVGRGQGLEVFVQMGFDLTLGLDHEPEVPAVAAQAGDNQLTHFNAGLLYFDMKDYDKALVQAHRAMALGMTRPDLRERLKAVGRWKEPEPADAPASAPTAAASAASQTSP